MENKYILLLGGTGAMGSYLTPMLAKGGVDVYCTSRYPHKGTNRIHYLLGNANENGFLEYVLSLKHWDAIVNFMSYSTKDFKDKYEILLKSTKQYVFLSSSRVYAESEYPLTEDSPRLLDVCKDYDYLKTDEYALAKARQEDILKNSGKTNYTIIRPYVTFSDYRLQLSCEEKESWLYRCLNGRTIVFSNDLAEKRTTFTYGEDVARGISSIIGKEEALGEAFHITNQFDYPWLKIESWYLDAIEHETGIRPKVMLTDAYQPFYGGNFLQVKYDRLYNRKFDNSKIGNFIDLNTFTSTREAIFKCVHNFIARPKFGYINWTQEALKDKLTGERATLKEIINIKGKKSKAKYVLTRYGLYHPKL